jgi:hypothetical protein
VGKYERHAEFLSENLNVRENWKDLLEDESVILKWIGEVWCLIVD